MQRLQGKRAIITGSGSGIGRAIARRFAAEGAEVSVLDRCAPTAEQTAAEIVANGGIAKAFVADISDNQQVKAAFDSLDKIDILVNNAAVSSIGNLESTTPEELDRIYSINVKGTFHCLQAAVTKMKLQGGGNVLNVASIAARLGIQERFAYSMSKGAVLSMTLSVARDYLGQNIRCNCICPARVHTPFVDDYLDAHFSDRKDEMFAKLSSYQPIGRMGRPEEIAALAAFLCSDESSFITGAAYDIDGGAMQLR